MMGDAENGSEERLSAESYGNLDVSQAGAECWMIRVPQKLAELVEKAPEGTDLGEIVFTKGGTTKQGAKSKPALAVHVSEALATKQQAAEAKPEATRKPSSTIPLNYSLQAMTKKVPVMHPLTRNPKTGSVKLMGTVSRTANLQVEQDSNYRQLLKDRLVASNINSNRFVKPVDATESVMSHQMHSSVSAAAAIAPVTSDSKKTFGNAVFQFGKRKMEAASQDSTSLAQQQQEGSKKARQFEPDQPLKSVIFALFSEQQYWTFKDLKAAAVDGGATAAGGRKAEKPIRDILGEIAEYHRSGDHKTMWELRKEFQQAK